MVKRELKDPVRQGVILKDVNIRASESNEYPMASG